MAGKIQALQRLNAFLLAAGSSRAPAYSAYWLIRPWASRTVDDIDHEPLSCGRRRLVCGLRAGDTRSPIAPIACSGRTDRRRHGQPSPAEPRATIRARLSALCSATRRVLGDRRTEGGRTDRHNIPWVSVLPYYQNRFIYLFICWHCRELGVCLQCSACFKYVTIAGLYLSFRKEIPRVTSGLDLGITRSGFSGSHRRRNS